LTSERDDGELKREEEGGRRERKYLKISEGRNVLSRS
jgi:hypothetical protein